ncbi:MAG: hypothetical protein AAGJ37_07655 [Pseudomonadota bacterium]
MSRKTALRNLHQVFVIVLSSYVLFACTLSNKEIETQTSQQTQPASSTDQQQPILDNEAIGKETDEERFYMQMQQVPFLPGDTSHRHIACEMQMQSSDLHKTSDDIDYSNEGWEKRIPMDVALLKKTASMGRVLLIDTIYTDAGPAYRYFSNDTHDELYEPWSSSKIFAYSGALAQMRKKGVGAPGMIGESNVSDMITTIHSYAPFGTSNSSSNDLATYFANVAGRDYLTSLFFDAWLGLSNTDVFFRGAYGPSTFVPESDVWIDERTGKTASINAYQTAQDDPGYLAYRCDKCSLTGNKPMTTLAQAEWLKRLAMHETSPQTAHPFLTIEDVRSLFYGIGNSVGQDNMAGMTQGISNMLHRALANQIDNRTSTSNVLDDNSDGKWRIFQKIGWGPSETRGTTENVMLAHVCLPNTDNPERSLQFTIAAQVAVDQSAEANIPIAGLKMQALLDAVMALYFNEKAN